MPDGDTPWSLKGAVLITDDEGGVATLLAQELTRRGATPVVVGMERSGSNDRGHSRVDLADRAAAGRFLDDLRNRHGRIGAIVHLSPLTDRNSGADPDARRWMRRLDAELHSLFNMAQHLEGDLRHEGAGWLMAATRMGGTFGSAGAVHEFWPGHGAICGWVKTAAREWTDVACRAVDFDFDTFRHVNRSRVRAYGAELSFGRTMRLELSSQEVVFGTDDFKEGTQSFMEKRTPKFRGS
ncbi:MAG: SDR family oxidoreductase [Candidatus Dadabacteria bacterium]|nr:SDR family oxidoreductase [Candidatus Dadabacteria bacterium]